MDKNKCSSCGETKCSCKNKDFTKRVIEIDNPEQITLIRKVTIPASMGDDTTVPPVVGKYKNVLLFYEANSKSYLYSSDGIPTQLVNGFTNYEEAINLPEINGVTLMGNKSSADLKLADAPMVITVAAGNTSWSGADTAEDVYNFFLNKGKVNIVFNGGENYAYEIASAAYIPEEEKMMCTLAVATIAAGETSEFEGNALFGTMTLYTAGKAIDVSQIELQPKLYIADFTGLDLNYNELSGVPATNASIGMVKPGDGLEVATDGTLSISDIEQYAHFFDTVADMKAATNLVAGDYAKTLGYYTVNDGGGALYKIGNTGTANEIDIIEVGNLKAHIIKNDEMNIKQFGADATGDITDILNTAFEYCDTLVIPEGEYELAHTIHIPESKTIKGQKENSIIKYKGTGRAFICDGRYITLKDFKFIVDTSISSDDPKIGISVDSRYSEEHAGNTLTNIIIESIVFEDFNISISLDNMWQVTIRNCIIKGLTKGTEDDRTCYGINYANSGTVLTNWSGSGNIIESCHIQRCSHGLHIEGGWNVTAIDTIIENCYCSLYCVSCWRTVLINDWFESNEIQPVLNNAPTIMIGGRKGKLTDGTTDEFPSNLNNLHIIDTTGTSTNIYNQKLISTIPNTQAMISGVKDQVPVGTPTDIVSLRAYTSRFNVIQNQTISNNFLTGELSITGHSDLAQNGRSYSTLQFKSGTTSGSEVGTALRTVFNIDRDGGITNPASNGAVNIGSADHMYNYGYFNNIIIKGDNNNVYKVKVDSSGNLTAVQV